MKKALSISLDILLFLVSVYFIFAFANSRRISVASEAASEAAQLYLAKTCDEDMVVSHVSYFYSEEIFFAYYYPASNPDEEHCLYLGDRNRWKGPFDFYVWRDEHFESP